MTLLYEALDASVAGWRDQRYAHDTYPAISEILDYAFEDDGSPRYLRAAQFKALETY